MEIFLRNLETDKEALSFHEQHLPTNKELTIFSILRQQHRRSGYLTSERSTELALLRQCQPLGSGLFSREVIGTTCNNDRRNNSLEGYCQDGNLNIIPLKQLSSCPMMHWEKLLLHHSASCPVPINSFLLHCTLYKFYKSR